MILVVGGAGYIGSHMLKVLRQANEPHLVFDNLETGHRSALGDSPLVQGDLRTPADIKRLFDQNKDIDVVIHFAAYISVGESVRDPNKYYRNIVLGSLNLLDAMRQVRVGKIVFSSTAAVYGNPQYCPIDEGHPTSPINPYGKSKLMVEEILGDSDRAYGLKSVCLRYFNAAGADPGGLIGEDHAPEEHLIPNSLLAALGRQQALSVFGNDYPTADGTCVRDYIHVLDLASAHLLAVRHLREGGNSRQYNLGNEQGFSVKQVIEAVTAVTDLEVPHEYGPRRPGDSPELVADCGRIRRDWGWKPEYTDVAEIIRSAWKWHSARPNGYDD